MAKFGCIIVLDQFDTKHRETICPFSSEAPLVMLESAVCSSVPTSASKSIILSFHCALPIAMEMLSYSCKRKAKIRKKNAFRLLDYVFLYTTGPKVIGFQFSLLDWSLLVLAAHGPHLEVFRLTNVICGHMLDYSVLSSDLWLYRCSNL